MISICMTPLYPFLQIRNLLPKKTRMAKHMSMLSCAQSPTAKLCFAPEPWCVHPIDHVPSGTSFRLGRSTLGGSKGHGFSLGDVESWKLSSFLEVQGGPVRADPYKWS